MSTDMQQREVVETWRSLLNIRMSRGLITEPAGELCWKLAIEARAGRRLGPIKYSWLMDMSSLKTSFIIWAVMASSGVWWHGQHFGAMAGDHQNGKLARRIHERCILIPGLSFQVAISLRHLCRLAAKCYFVFAAFCWSFLVIHHQSCPKANSGIKVDAIRESLCSVKITIIAKWEAIYTGFQILITNLFLARCVRALNQGGRLKTLIDFNSTRWWSMLMMLSL